MSQDRTPPVHVTPVRVPMTAAGLAARVVFLVAWLIALTALIFAARGAAPGGPVAERIGYAVGAALVPWALGTVTLVSLSRGKRLTWRHLALSSFVMAAVGLWSAGQGLVSRAHATASSNGDAFDGFIAELKQDYPDVYAQREAIVAQRGSSSLAEVGLRMAAATAPALKAARSKINDELATETVHLQLQEYREAMARSPQACWGLATGAAPGELFDARTTDWEYRLRTRMLRDAATGSSPPGPVITADELRGLIHVVTIANADDAQIVRPVIQERRPPASDVEARALCRWQMAFLNEILRSGPELTGKFVRGV